jgi:hypothetical protein
MCEISAILDPKRAMAVGKEGLNPLNFKGIHRESFQHVGDAFGGRQARKKTEAYTQAVSDNTVLTQKRQAKKSDDQRATVRRSNPDGPNTNKTLLGA